MLYLAFMDSHVPMRKTPSFTYNPNISAAPSIRMEYEMLTTTKK